MPDRIAEQDHSILGRDETVQRLRREIRNFTDSNVSPAPAGLQRSSSTIITPTQSLRSVGRKASFNLEEVEGSGFTPEHDREETRGGTFPRSGMMLNLRDTRARLRYPLREDHRDIQLSRSMDNAPPIMTRLADVPARQQQRISLRNLESAVSATPRRMKKSSLWDSNRDGYREDQSRLVGSTDVLDQTVDTSRSVHRFPSTTTRDFSQQAKLKKQQPKHKPVPVDAHRPSTQRCDHPISVTSPVPIDEGPTANERKTPSPTESRSTVVLRTPSSTIGGFFRKRVRSEHGAPTAPRTPASPRTHWRPFDEPEPEPPCSTPWLSGQGEDKKEKEARAAYFREKAERELEGIRPPRRSSRKGSFGSTKSKEDIRRKGLGLDHRQSMESLVGWKSFIVDAPEPLFSSPAPPVPPIPTASQLNLTLNRLPQAQAQAEAHAHAPHRAVSAEESSPASGYRGKKPQGLKVETRKLRKASREGLRETRTPSSTTAGRTPASGSGGGGFRTAFRLDGRRMSFGRVAAEEQRQLRQREDEVVPRRR
ncbi:hypothetical protein ACJ41O_011579 [Fusarium nematophilum]